ncbi:hypothetical protein BHC51_11630 [Snodgrassella alvi]|nr:hypothetical protein BHC51_11630 [Snodgrassella alvi]
MPILMCNYTFYLLISIFYKANSEIYLLNYNIILAKVLIFKYTATAHKGERYDFTKYLLKRNVI